MGAYCIVVVVGEGRRTHSVGDLVEEAPRSEAVVEPAKDLEVKYCSTQTVVEGGIH